MPSGHRVHCIYSTEREGTVSDHPALGAHHRAPSRSRRTGFYTALVAATALLYFLILRALRHVPRSHPSSPDHVR